MNDNIFIQFATAFINSSLWKVVFIFIVAYIAGNIIKSMASTIYQYIMIKTDIFGVGSVVDYKGIRGTIRNIGLRRIELDVKDSCMVMYIRTFDWPNLILIVPYECKFEHKD